MCRNRVQSPRSRHLLARSRSRDNELGRATNLPTPEAESASLLLGWYGYMVTRLGSAASGSPGFKGLLSPSTLLRRPQGLMFTCCKTLCPNVPARRPRADCFCISVLMAGFFWALRLKVFLFARTGESGCTQSCSTSLITSAPITLRSLLNRFSSLHNYAYIVYNPLQDLS